MNENLKVTHNLSEKRFEIQIDSHLAVLDYVMQGATITFMHTGVHPALEGRGIGSLLVKTGLQYAKDKNLKIKSLCWFVDKYIQRHPE
jgi:predicted GNAT family acetyltransferase